MTSRAKAVLASMAETTRWDGTVALHTSRPPLQTFGEDDLPHRGER